MKIQNVVIAGGGVLGSQIAYQCSYAGFHVTTYLRSEASVERARPKVARLHGIYTAELQAAKAGATPVSRGLVMNQDPAGADFDKLLQKADAAYEGFHYETDLAAAVADADLVIEALAEQPEAKEAFFSQLSPLPPLCCPAFWRSPQAALQSFLPCTLPITSGSRTLPRSWGTAEPLRKPMRLWHSLPQTWA